MAVCGAERPRISFPSRFMNPPHRRTMEALCRRRRGLAFAGGVPPAAKQRTPGLWRSAAQEYQPMSPAQNAQKNAEMLHCRKHQDHAAKWDPRSSS